MIPKKQTRLVIPGQRGNCLPAVIASILEMEVEDVIQIQEHYDNPKWFEILDEWLKERGYSWTDEDNCRSFHENQKTYFENRPEMYLDIGLNHIDENAAFNDIQNSVKDKFYFVSGVSPRDPKIRHIVIYQNGKMVHDPHPDNTGILTEEYFSILKPIS